MQKPAWQVRIAKERIEILFRLARQELERHPERSRRYVQLARRIGMRYNVRLRKFRREFCKACNTLLIPGKTSSIRLHEKLKIVKCLHCNKVYKIPYY